MGHSRVTKNEFAIEVRDSTFEIVLELMREELEHSNVGLAETGLRTLVSEWAEYWFSMPPGCKALDIGALTDSDAQQLASTLETILRRAPEGSETSLVINQVLALLRTE